jgi:hypothetical protein
MPKLAARKVAIDVVRGDLEPSRQALDHGRKAGSMGFPCSYETNASHAKTLSRGTRNPGAAQVRARP